MKKIIVILGLLIAGIAYFRANLKQSNWVDIKAPIETVWAYVSDSSRAQYWSIYFDHIRALDHKDGQVGSVRRCFRRADEKLGSTWDEKTLDVKAPTFRKIQTYNLKGFNFEGHEQLSFYVFQRLEKKSRDLTRLYFDSRLKDFSKILKNFKLFKHLLFEFKPEAQRIIQANLENIKSAIENSEALEAPFAYEPRQKWDLD